jgi:hypothetical protein
MAKNVSLYVDTFRSSLSTNVLSDPLYSFKVFLIPKPANRESSADIAVEFVKFDPSNAEEMARYNRVVSLIKPTVQTIGVRSQNAGAVLSGATRVRIVDATDAPGVQRITYDDTHPYTQQKLIESVNRRLPEGSKINRHDVLTVRRVHDIESNENYFYKGMFGQAQYSEEYVDWLVSKYEANNDFFQEARATFRANRE